MNIREWNTPGRSLVAAMLTLWFSAATAQAQSTAASPVIDAPSTSQQLTTTPAPPPSTLAITAAVFGTTANGAISGVHGENTSAAGSPAVGVQGSTQSTASSVAAVLGVVVPTAPGGFSAAVRGMNNGTGGLGIGVWGSQAGSGWGVYGVTPNGLGVYGNSTGAGYGVYGNSTGGYGVYGTTTSSTTAGVFAASNASGVGVALEVSGAIKASGANRAAFRHTATPANITSSFTTIDSPMTNGDANAILIVTPVLLPPNNQVASFPIGVSYDTGSSKWTIFNQFSSGFPANAAFNVLVIKQ